MNPFDWLASVLRKANGKAEEKMDRLEQRHDAALAHADQALTESRLIRSAREMDDRLARRGR